MDIQGSWSLYLCSGVLTPLFFIVFVDKMLIHYIHKIAIIGV